MAAHPEELSDPIGDLVHSPEFRFVHRYPDRLLILTTDRCFRYCRFCFRKHWTGRGLAAFGPEERDRLGSYLDRHPQVREVILSGGDALTLPNSELIPLLRLVRQRGRLVRLSTRLASLAPQRLDSDLLQALGELGGIWWLHHVNHPDELHEGFQTVVRQLSRMGVGQVSQSVLLADLNDDPQVLLDLFTGLSRLGVKPYYLFYTDLAAGTSDWRLDLEDALEVWNQVKNQASRLILPTFAVDLPGGRGKVEVETHFLRTTEQGWVFRSSDGSEVLYPRAGLRRRLRTT